VAYVTGSPEIDALPRRESFIESGPEPFWLRIPQGHPRALDLEGGILLTSYQDCRAVLMNPVFRKANLSILQSMPDVDPRFVDRRRKAILDMEGPDHLRLRALAMPALSAARSQEWRPYMRAVMSGLLDAVEGAGACEAGASLCRPYPIPVVCAVLGVPAEQVAFFTRCAEAWTRWIREGASGVPAAMAAHDEMDDFLGELIARRRGEPSNDLVSALIRSEEEGDRLTTEEIVHLVAGLVVAGTDTTRMALGSALYLFARHPEQWRALRTDPSLVAGAVEEVLRYAPVSALLRRVANEDVNLEGLSIEAGTTVFIAPATANRDPSAYADPQLFSIRRETPRRHMTFGGGRKHCLGAHLARAELQEALLLLSARLPGLALDGEAAWAPPRSLLQGAVTVPIRWSAA
jgi:cytochrome P450